MGTDVHIMVSGTPGDPDGTARRAHERLLDLEQRWSRFIPGSEISQLNAAASRSAIEGVVSSDTAALISRGLIGMAMTSGRFDPTMVSAIVAAGYDRSLPREIKGPPPHQPVRPGRPSNKLRIGAIDPGSVATRGVQVDVATSTVVMAAGGSFDPGGIGKGFAADLVSAEAMAEGADGVLVNIGGDVRVRGCGPDGESWRIAIEDPRHDDGSTCNRSSLDVITLDDGAVATSSQVRRRWVGPSGAPAHHLIDPATGSPSHSTTLAATAVAAEGWQAEVLAKLAFLDGVTDGDSLQLIESLGTAALIVTPELVAVTSAWEALRIRRNPVPNAGPTREPSRT